jgi:hypothetical protein
MTIFYCLRFETPNLVAMSQYLYPPGTGRLTYTCNPRHWVPFSSPPMTRRAMVEVFEPAFTRGQQQIRSSQSYFTIGGLPTISSSCRQAPWHSRPAIFFQLNTWYHSSYVTSSLTRGRVCSLQLLLVLASRVILMSDSRGLVTIFYCLKFKTPPTLRVRSPYIYPPGTGWPGYTLRHWVPFSSPPTTHRSTVEVFEPASTRGTWVAPLTSLEPLCTDRIENTVSKSNFIVIDACLPRCCKATAVVSLFVSRSLPSNGSVRVRHNRKGRMLLNTTTKSHRDREKCEW